ncbi:MAG: trehalose-phosphatase [Erythrobacter sp.]
MQQESFAPPPSLDDLLDRGPVALFLDFDGTLVEIAPTHDSIEVHVGLPRELEELSARLDGRLALVSGRSLENLASYIGHIAIAQAGSHGADCRLADSTRIGTNPRKLSSAIRADLEILVSQHSGASLETKSHGAAIHYRARPEIEGDVVAAAQAIAKDRGLSVKRGKSVIELLANSTDKGDAVRALIAHATFAGSRPLFVGDDLTDEDGFAAVKEFEGLGVLVGGSRESEACYRLSDPHDVHQWLGLELE